MDAVAQALADPIRREILLLLRDRNVTAGAIAERFPVSRPAVSRHLRVLREAGLVREEGDERDARARVYTLEREAFGGVKNWLEDVESFWADQLASLREHVESKVRMRGG